MGALSRRNDLRDSGVSSQIAKQDAEVKAFMKAPFEPELAGSSLAAANVALSNPHAAKGRDIYEQQGCNACHGDNGIGSAAGPKLIGLGNKFDSQQLEALLKRTSAAMTQGGMTDTDLDGEDLKGLITYLESLK